jgi:hypothetical protein
MKYNAEKGRYHAVYYDCLGMMSMSADQHDLEQRRPSGAVWHVWTDIYIEYVKDTYSFKNNIYGTLTKYMYSFGHPSNIVTA